LGSSLREQVEGSAPTHILGEREEGDRDQPDCSTFDVFGGPAAVSLRPESPQQDASRRRFHD
jgi:hypothetical protein